MHNENDGIAVLNGDCAGMACKTVLVLGAPRGGTSMVAGTLSKLGIYLGPNFRLAPLFENPELNLCAQKKDSAQAKNIIARFNESHPVWGMKVLPGGWWFFLARRLFRQPVYIVVFRDILAIAKRRELALDKALFKEMFSSNNLNFWLLVFLAFTKRPVLMLSYEKAVLNPGSFVNGLASFLGVSDPALLEEAVQFIKPSPESYRSRAMTAFCQLDAAANYFGYLDLVETDKIAGWALSLFDKNPVQIEITVKGQSKKILEANMPREDVRNADARFRNHCGFVVSLNGQDQLQKGDFVEVKILGKNIHLVNSPYVVE